MIRRFIKIASVLIFIFGVGLTLQAGDPIPVAAQSTVRRTQQLKKQSRRAGRRSPAAEKAQRARREKAAQARLNAARTRLAMRRRQLVKQQQAKLQAGNGKIRAELKKLRKGYASPQLRGDRRAAAKLHKRSRTTSSDKVQILDKKTAKIFPTTGGGKPKIKTVFLPNLTPGWTRIIAGSSFGSSPGKVWVHLMKYNKHQFMKVLFTVSEWHPTYIAGYLPEDLGGFRDQKGFVQVETAGKTLSKQYPVMFLATKEIIELSESADINVDPPAVTVVSCGEGANTNRCSGLSGWHENSWGAVGYDKGTDVFQMYFKNDWTLAHAEITRHKTSSNEKITGPVPSFPMGSSYWKASFDWVVSPADFLFWYISVDITGPKGVPWN